jgi:hypothetical protein
MIRNSHDIKLAHVHNPKQQSVIKKPYIIGMTDVNQNFKKDQNRERDNEE